MRDNRCDKESLEAVIQVNPRSIAKRKKIIKELLEDEANGIQNNSVPNLEIVQGMSRLIFQADFELLHSQYSYGMDLTEFDSLYEDMIGMIHEIDVKEIDYIDLIHFISLGILLQKDKKLLTELVEKLDKEALNDIFLDSILEAYGLERKYHSDQYCKENPYIFMVDIICAANSNQKNVSELLYDYVTKKWLKGHSDLGWVKAVKESDFLGLWAYEAAAVAKLFDIDDSSLKDAEFYPYDLAHYKTTAIKASDRNFSIPEQKEMSYEAEEEELIIDAKNIIPPCMYKYVNSIVNDYKQLSDKGFFDKYELDQIWFDLDEYIKDNKGKDILGMILVFELAIKGYILQLDWKEDFEDFRDHMKNYWSKEGETKIVTFELDNDQQYFAKIPVENSVHDLFEVSVKEYTSI